MRNTNPYAGINWEKSHRIHTSTHNHVTKPESLACTLAKGYELLTISNYYPSKPYYPLSSVKVNTFACSQEHGVLHNGKFEEGPINWNEVISQWEDELTEEERGNFPFKEGEPLFPPLPEGILEAPNAEHHSFTDCDLIMERGLHITAPGSLWASGHFATAGRYGLKAHGYTPGAGIPWREAFRKILDNLLWEEGGGIIINHPTHTQCIFQFLLDALDFDDRVLGLEVWNTTLSSEGVWDSVLRTGRQCFGFFVPDHFNKLSRMYNPMNILLTEERTARACMKAYREGAFYGCLLNTGLGFEKISFEGDTLTVQTNKEAFIEVIGFPGVLAYARGKEIKYTLAMKKEAVVFLRVRAFDETGERIFSQPIILP